MLFNEMRIELVSRDDFWRHAFTVEWEFQYPQRKLGTEVAGYFQVSADWVPDLERVAEQCFSSILLAPSDPGRRNMLRVFLPRQES